MWSYIGERLFICDFDSCGWIFISMFKFLRYRRKYDDDWRFICFVEGCGKLFMRVEYLKGYSIIYLGIKLFECFVEGCCVRFFVCSSLYIYFKKYV